MMKNNENKIESRRNFLKKAAYAVPTVIAISQITNPMSATAAASTTKLKTGGTETNVSTAPGTDRSDARNLFGKK
jgi:hypothetical protein